MQKTTSASISTGSRRNYYCTVVKHGMQTNCSVGYILYVQTVHSTVSARAMLIFLVWFLKKKKRTTVWVFNTVIFFLVCVGRGSGLLLYLVETFLSVFFLSRGFQRLFVGVMNGRLSVFLWIGLEEGVQPMAKARSTIFSTVCERVKAVE